PAGWPMVCRSGSRSSAAPSTRTRSCAWPMPTSAPPASPTSARRPPGRRSPALDTERAESEAAAMRIGELARAVGVSADTLRFYERSGLLPRPRRAGNNYRDYGPPELERIRLLLD